MGDPRQPHVQEHEIGKERNRTVLAAREQRRRREAAEQSEHRDEALFDWDKLRRHMRRLTDDQREVLALRYGLELSLRETALRMGRSEGAVKQLQARAVWRLTELLTATEVRA